MLNQFHTNQGTFIQNGAEALSYICLILCSFIILTWDQSAGYEISIYLSVPIYYWITTATGLISSFFFIAYNYHESSYLTRNGVVQLFLFNVMLILTPLLRGYRGFARGDPLTHLGYTKYINNSRLFDTIIYPWLHIDLAVIAEVMSIDIFGLTLFYPQIMYFCLLLSLIILFRRQFGIRSAIFPIAVIFIPMYQNVPTLMDPFHTSIFFIPLFLYVYLRYVSSSERRYVLILSIITFALSLAHPISSIITLMFLILHLLLSIFTGDIGLTEIKYVTGISTIWLVTNMYWFTQFNKLILKGASTLGLYGKSASAAQTYASLAAVASLKDIIFLIVSRYGTTIFISVLSVCVFIYYLTNNRNRITDVDFSFYAVGISLMVIFSLIGLFTFVGPSRFFVYINIMGMGILAQFAYHKRNTRLGRSVIAVLLSVLLVLSMMNVFPSYSITKSPNRQVTTQQLNVVDWIYDNRQHNIRVDSVMIHIKKRWGRYLYPIPPDINTPLPPSGFNYNSTEAYLLTSKVGKAFYPRAYPDYKSRWRYTPGDYRDLNTHYNKIKVYSNGNNSIFYNT